MAGVEKYGYMIMLLTGTPGFIYYRLRLRIVPIMGKGALK
jgi:hypothetical protein